MNHMDLLTGFVDCSKFEGATSPDYRVFVMNENGNLKDYFLKKESELKGQVFN